MKPSGTFNPLGDEIMIVEESDMNFSKNWEDLSIDEKANFCSYMKIGFMNSEVEPTIKFQWASQQQLRKLTSENVSRIVSDCLFRTGEDTSNAEMVQGFRHKFGFNPEKLEKNQSTIMGFLNQLADEFKDGGGWSFLQACMDKEGEQWGEHSNVDELICLGMAIEKVEFVFEKEMWVNLPGGMPYIVIKD